MERSFRKMNKEKIQKDIDRYQELASISEGEQKAFYYGAIEALEKALRGEYDL
jgi:hypothetical protein